MAFRSHNFALATTFAALCLKLLNEPRAKPSSFCHLSLTIALCAGFHIVRVFSSRTSAVRANRLSCVFNCHVFTCVKVCKGYFNLDRHIWSCSLLLLSKSSSEEIAKNSSERIMAPLSFRLICTFFTALIVLSSFVRIT